MAITVQADDIVECLVNLRIEEQVCINTFHYQVLSVTGAPTINLGAVLTEFVLATFDGLSPAYPGVLTLDISAIFCTAQRINPTRSARLFMVPVNPAGTQPNPHLPSGASVVIRRQGDVAGRHNQGRIYVPGIPATNVDAAAPSKIQPGSPGLTDYATITTLLNTNLTATDGGVTAVLQPILVDKTSGGVGAIVTRVFLDPIIRYQRRRELQVGI